MRRIRYSDFFNELVTCLYWENVRSQQTTSFENLASKFGIKYEPGFLAEAQRDLSAKGLIRGPDPIGGDSTALGRLTGEGLRYAEQNGLDNLEEDEPDSEERMALASDRIVSFDHNSTIYQKIADEISDLQKFVSESNSLEINGSERSRLSQSLIAASALWAATELKWLQFKVGVLMAIEDTVQAVATSAKAVAAALLVDTIKAFVKSHTGIDLDHI